jgi:hypothetical protein
MRPDRSRSALAALSTLAIITTLLAVPAGSVSTQPNPPVPCPPAGSTTSLSSTTAGPSSTGAPSTAAPTTAPPETSAPTETSSGSTEPPEASSESTATSPLPTVSTASPTAGADRCDTLQALQQAMPSVIAYSLNPLTTTPDPGASLTTKGDDTKVNVPENPHADVRLDGSSTPPIAVGLPTGDNAKPAVLANEGVAVYQQAAPETTVAVQPVGLGAVRIMQAITGPKAPTTYRFPLRIPTGGSIKRAPGEQDRYAILDANGDGVASISAPWSQDHDKRGVPTRYRLDGQALVQEVDHAGFTYPVVADPLVSLGCAWFQCSVYLSRSATGTLSAILKASSGATGDIIALAAEAACIGLSVGTAAVLCILAGKVLGQLLIDSLVDASGQGGCLRIRFGPPLLLSVGSLSASNSRHCNDGARYDGKRRPLPPGERMVNANHATYLVVGGAKLWIPNRDEFEALGYDWSKVESLSREGLRQFEDVPIDGTLVKERSDSHTFVISGRHRWWVQDREQFDKNHFDWKNVHIVANGSLVSAPYAGPLP